MKLKDKLFALCIIGSIVLSLSDSGMVAEAANRTQPQSNKTSATAAASSSSSTKAKNTLSAIHAACSTTAACQEDWDAAVIDTDSKVNPYDCIYDYGEAYDAYVAKCDWSLVFDADYYMDTFPMLAAQYHYDEDLLLMHFQTVGVHEGRQGCENFNVGAYYYNCRSNIRKSFGQDWASYYIYYMMNYSSQKSVDTASAKNRTLYQQYKIVKTVYQQAEFDAVNAYRKEKGLKPYKYDSELAAWANYRGYLNAHDGWEAHDWAKENSVELDSEGGRIINRNTSIDGFHASENTVTSHGRRVDSDKVCAPYYRKSESHYQAMISEKFEYIGCSNVVWHGGVKNPQSQFDFFMDGDIDTAFYPAG